MHWVIECTVRLGIYTEYVTNLHAPHGNKTTCTLLLTTAVVSANGSHHVPRECDTQGEHTYMRIQTALFTSYISVITTK